MRNVSAATLVILVTANIAAQIDPGKQPRVSFVQSNTSCPVGFGADLSALPVMRSVDGGKTGGSSLLLELSFDRLDTPSIKDAEITVHGLSAKGRVLPVQASPQEDALQAFHLHRSTDGTGLNRADVWVTKVATARWVEITSLQYADGSSWHASKTAQCRASLSGFKPV